MMEVTVLTEDGHTLQIPSDLLPLITLVEKTAELGPIGAPIPLPKIRGCTFIKVLEWAQLHKEDPTIKEMTDNTSDAVEDKIKIKLALTKKDFDDEDEDDTNMENGESSDSEDEPNFASEKLEKDILLCPADRKFLEQLDIPSLIDLTAAANYLAIEPLLDICCKAIANHMSGLSVEELRLKFNIPNDFTPEEEAKLKSEFGWADE